MSFTGTLAKIAVGYAAARGVDHLSGGDGLGEMLGGGPGSEMSALWDSDAGTGADGGLFGGDGLGGMFDGFSDGAGGDGDGGLLGLAGIVGVLGLAGGAVAATTSLGDILSGHVDDGATRPEDEERAKLMLRAMIQAAKSDGGIDMREKQRILATLGDASPGELAFVTQQMQAPVDPGALAADTPEGLRDRVYGAALMTIKPDRPAEARFLSDLGTALGLTHAQRAALHRQMASAPRPG